MIPALTLFHYWRSSSSWRVRWALEVKNLKAHFVHVNLLNGESESPEHLARNPQGFVPVLQIGEKYLTESVAILEWLEELIPSPALYPGDAYLRAHIRSLVEIINADTQPIQNLVVLDKVSDDEEKRKAWTQFFIRRGLNAFQDRIKGTSGKFSVGDSLTAADILLIPQMYNGLRVDLKLSEFPTLEKIYNTALSTPAGSKSAPDNYKPN